MLMPGGPGQGKPRKHTLSIAIPGSVVDNAQNRELKTYLVRSGCGWCCCVCRKNKLLLFVCVVVCVCVTWPESIRLEGSAAGHHPTLCYGERTCCCQLALELALAREKGDTQEGAQRTTCRRCLALVGLFAARVSSKLDIHAHQES